MYIPSKYVNTTFSIFKQTTSDVGRLN